MIDTNKYRFSSDDIIDNLAKNAKLLSSKYGVLIQTYDVKSHESGRVNEYYHNHYLRVVLNELGKLFSDKKEANEYKKSIKNSYKYGLQKRIR